MITDILTKLQSIFREVFADESLEIDATTHPDQIEAWDSLRHAMLISAIEQGFDIKFDLMEMISFETVGDICAGVQKKLS